MVIRYNVFETNSSSVHALAFINDEAFDAWKNFGAYIDLRDIVTSDYISDDEDTIDNIPDISDQMILPCDIEEVRKQLPQEEYYETDDDCLLEAGILPYEAYTGNNGRPSVKWASICGGINYIDYTETEEGYNIEADWYRW